MTFAIGEHDFLLHGKPFQILSGSIHYFRVHQDQWSDRIRKARQMGLNTIETYVAWNAHARREGEFDLSGNLVKRLIPAGGKLNAPWGMAMAPANFGVFSNALLVGNFGDGRINAYDPTRGASLGTLSTPAGTPIAIDGLWGIAFGNGINGQPVNTLFFAAGPVDETHGVYGRIDNQ